MSNTDSAKGSRHRAGDCQRSAGRARDRGGSGIVLLLVLVVVAMLALGAYSFAWLMNIEAQASKGYGRLIQARMAADSAIDYLMALLADQKLSGTLGIDLYDNADQLHAIQLVPGQSACFFSLISPRHTADTAGSGPIRFGVQDESARINLNVLTAWLESAAESAGGAAAEEAGNQVPNPLLNLPNMDYDIADAILDWLDADDDPRIEGAEWDYYATLDPPYQPRNGPIESLDELLLVRGVTPRLLYGEDVNFNGVLDPNEDDGEVSYPYDDANGELDRGWLAYLTLYSRESNKDSLGTARINLNQDDLEALYEELAADPDLGEEVARFVVAYRLFGPSEAAGSSSGQQARAEGGGAEAGGQGAEGSGQAGAEQQEAEGPKEIAGLDASGGPKFQLKSVLDLIEVTVEAKLASETPEDQEQPSERIESPFKGDNLADYIDTLLDRTTISDEKYFIGRINVNTAPFEVLMAVPGMSEELAEAIIAARQVQFDDTSEQFWAGTGWLLSSGTLELDEYKKFEPYITGRTQVFGVQAVGYFHGSGTVARLEAVIDVSGELPRLLLCRDLSPLGRGFDPRQLLMQAGYQVTATIAK